MIDLVNSGEGAHSVQVALLGRPNVGKSTLLNCLAGKKCSITSPRAQTTRCQLAVHGNSGDGSTLWLDTPGISFRHKHVLHKVMHRNAMQAAQDADISVFMIEALRWLPEDERILRQLQQGAEGNSILVAINKCDKLRDKARLLPFAEKIISAGNLAGVEPLFISARSGKGVDQLVKVVQSMLPDLSRDGFIGNDGVALNDGGHDERKLRFWAAELMREKLIRRLSDELPHQLYVKTESIGEIEAVTHIDLSITVASKGQKAIVIGAGGAVLKQTGTQVRLELEKQLGKKVHLTSMVKVHANWFNDQEQLAAATKAP